MKKEDFEKEFPKLLEVINALDVKVIELENRLSKAEQKITELEKPKTEN